ncbi:hypothetical protein [Enterobacter cloacae]|uniref:hypothetical protein n=1 Tax=Enterobacter cloacae TaxID=550 RepID=UPI003984F830
MSNDTAFPTDESNYEKIWSSPGMTLRDYFAAKAMSGWLASYPESCTHPIVAGNADEVAKHSYMLADAMLKARG